MITRRNLFALLPFALATSARGADHPSVVFMNEVASQLLRAHRLGTASAFARVIQRYADISGIADASLGDYTLERSLTAQYHHSVVQFISYYFADQSRSYPIAKYEVGEPTVAPNKDVIIGSKVYLMAGQVYTVNWQLAWTNGSYKITDAKILGFSMVAQQRSMFTSFIAKNKGSAAELVKRLVELYH
jgi:ABC-type transporter MlaC component